MTYGEESFLKNVGAGDVRLELGLSRRGLTSEELLSRGQLDKVALSVIDRRVERSHLLVAVVPVDERI